jgi:cytosine/uracil/thiamine/allantoin permease
MRWWTKALIYSAIFSVIWVGLVVAVGYFHTDVFLAGQITPAQDRAISEKYGDLAGQGLGVVWVICFLVLWIRSRRTLQRPPDTI